MTPEERRSYYMENFRTVACGTYFTGSKISIGRRDQRTCRFCGRSPPSTTFRTQAHAIPEFLGNRRLVLLDECDGCNSQFARTLEDHLDKFTRPFRTLGQVAGKTRKVPSYKSRDGKSRIDVAEIVSIDTSLDASFCRLDTERNQLHLDLRTDPLVPIAVYKALVKIALSLLRDTEDLQRFRSTIRWISDTDHSRPLISPALLMRTFVPGPSPIVGARVAFLARREPGVEAPYAIFVVGFGNLIFQIAVPSEVDVGNSADITYSMPFVPSPFDFLDWPYGAVVKTTHDLTSSTAQVFKFPTTMSFNAFVPDE